MNNNYDTIIIGSGISGLTAAALLSGLKKKKVLVLEKHFIAGGQTHSFKRKGQYSWDSGLHFVGEMQEEWIIRWIFDYITDGKLKWNKLPDIYSNIKYPDLNVNIPSSKKEFKQYLIEQFPDEKKAIDKYFKDTKAAKHWLYRKYASQFLPFFIRIFIKLINAVFNKNISKTTGEYVEENFKSGKLKSIVLAHWLAYLLPPNECSFALHAMVTEHYLKGAYYPEGGAGKIADCIIPVIEKNGGKIMLKSEVKEIIVENNKAVGVIVKKRDKGEDIEETFYAGSVISSIGIPETYTKLIPKSVSEKVMDKINNFPKGYSVFQLYLGLKESPEKLGCKGENIFIYNEYDQEKIFKNADKILDGIPNHCYISFPSLKCREKTSHTAEVLYYMNYEEFSKWASQKWLKRDDEYYDLKNKLSDYLIDFIDSNIKGFKDIIDYKEIASPLSIEHFINKQYGAYNGIPGIPEKFTQNWINIKSPVKNLYNTGSDINTLGIIGAMMGGVATVSYMGGPLEFNNIILKSLLFKGSLAKK